MFQAGFYSVYIYLVFYLIVGTEIIIQNIITTEI